MTRVLDIATLAGDTLLAAATLGVGYVAREHKRNQNQLQENSRKLAILTDAELNRRIREEVVRQLASEAGRSLKRSLDAVLRTDGMDADEQEG